MNQTGLSRLLEPFVDDFISILSQLVKRGIDIYRLAVHSLGHIGNRTEIYPVNFSSPSFCNAVKHFFPVFSLPLALCQRGDN